MIFLTYKSSFSNDSTNTLLKAENPARWTGDCLCWMWKELERARRHIPWEGNGVSRVGDKYPAAKTGEKLLCICRQGSDRRHGQRTSLGRALNLYMEQRAWPSSDRKSLQKRTAATSDIGSGTSPTALMTSFPSPQWSPSTTERLPNYQLAESILILVLPLMGWETLNKSLTLCQSQIPSPQRQGVDALLSMASSSFEMLPPTWSEIHFQALRSNMWFTQVKRMMQGPWKQKHEE